jgi:hypothetical protein
MARQGPRNVASKCVPRKKRWNCSSLDYGYAKSGVLNYPAIVEDESCKSN